VKTWFEYNFISSGQPQICHFCMSKAHFMLNTRNPSDGQRVSSFPPPALRKLPHNEGYSTRSPCCLKTLKRQPSTSSTKPRQTPSFHPLVVRGTPSDPMVFLPEGMLEHRDRAMQLKMARRNLPHYLLHLKLSDPA
jgi:hypothetical protein